MGYKYLDYLERGKLEQARFEQNKEDFELPYNIPWRISYEYCKVNNQYHWIYAWVKIGWFPGDIFELSSNYLQNYDRLNLTSVNAVVVEGQSKDIIKKLVNKAPFINIMLEEKDGFLNLVDFAYDDARDDGKYFALAQLEIGQMTPLPQNQLDIFRRYQGCPDDIHQLYSVFY